MDELLPALTMSFGAPLNLDPAMWSLVVEIRLSLIFPVLIWLMRREPSWLALPTAIAISALAKVADLHNEYGPAVGLWVETIARLWLFVLGAWLGRRLAVMANDLPVFSRSSQIGMLSVALFVLVARWIVPAPLSISYFLSGVAAAALVVLALVGGGVRHFLERPVSQRLGQLSYSLYIYHFPVLATLCYALTPWLPFWTAICLTPPIALAVARLSQRFVERPCIALGRRVTRQLTALSAQMYRASASRIGTRYFGQPTGSAEIKRADTRDQDHRQRLHITAEILTVGLL